MGIELINVVSASIPVSVVDACIADQFRPVEESIDGNSFWCCGALRIIFCLSYFEVEELFQSSASLISGASCVVKVHCPHAIVAFCRNKHGE